MALRNALASTSKCPMMARPATSFQGGSDVFPIERLKPPSLFHYTGEPHVQDAIKKLRDLEVESRTEMRRLHMSDRFDTDLEGLFSGLGITQSLPLRIPHCKWQSAFNMATRLACPINEEQRSRIVEALESLHALLGSAALYDRLTRLESHEDSMTQSIVSALSPYIAGRRESAGMQEDMGEKAALASTDEYGRVAARGRAKSARATVWIIKTKHMPLKEIPGAETDEVHLPNPKNEVQSSQTNEDKDDRGQMETLLKWAGSDDSADIADPAVDLPGPLDMYGLSAEPTIGRVLVNNLPILDALPEISSRNVVLEPFALTQTLGDYNVFAVATRGGKSSRARAIAHAIARCLFEAEGETARQVLVNSGLLLTDPRVRLRSMPNRYGNRRTRTVSGRPGKRKRASRKS